MFLPLLLLACTPDEPPAPAEPAKPYPTFSTSEAADSACHWDEGEAIEEKYYVERGSVVPPDQRGHKDDIQRCYAEALQRDPAAGGRWGVKLCVVGGRATELKVYGDREHPDPLLDRCIEDAVKAWTWPPSAERFAYHRSLRFFPL